MRGKLVATVCLLALVGCGGGGGGDQPPPAAPAPPPAVPPAPPPPVIGSSGGTVSEASGASVIFPEGAVETDTTFRIAMDSTGAPVAPGALQTAGNVYVITPHGGNFQQPVEVRIPAPAVTLGNNQLLKIATAEPGGEWVILDDTQVVNGMLTTRVSHFSYFRPVVITYVSDLRSTDPLSFTTTLTCDGGSCVDVVGPVNTVYQVGSNRGVVPVGCDANTLFMARTRMNLDMGILTSNVRSPLTIDGGTWSEYLIPTGVGFKYHVYGIGWRCDAGYIDFGRSTSRNVNWKPYPTSLNVAVMRMPAQFDVVEGVASNLDVLLGGGQPSPGPGPTAFTRAMVEWQRSPDGSTNSWSTFGWTSQAHADPLPFGVGTPWEPWRTRYSFFATAADQGALVRVNVCYIGPCAVSAPARINVLQQSAPPVIVQQPRSVLIRTGQTANFTVTASGPPAPSLQWQTRAANSTGRWMDVTTGTGPTTDSFTTGPRTLADNGEQYRVVATNALGSTASAIVTLSVSDQDVAPSITTQPASLGVTTGSDALFAVVAHGTEALSYQWTFNGAVIAAANSPVLRLAGVTSANAGSYRVTVTNAAGSVTSNTAVLTVTSGTAAVLAPSIVTQPVSVTVNAGNTATFAVGVDGSGPLSFQWRRDGVNVAGANNATLTFAAVALPNAGAYSVVVSNAAGSVTSNAVILDVAPAAPALPPSITSQPATVIVPLTGSGVIAVGATGSGPLSYQWYRNGELMPGATLPVLNFSNLGDVDFATYTVTVSNSFGSVTSQSAALILLGAPAITQQPAAVSVLENDQAVFFVVASGSGLRYQWSVNGMPIPGAIAATLVTEPLVAANSGAVYSVAVYNGAGLVTSQGAVLTVNTLVAPSILSHPANATIQPGASAEMCVTIGGTPTFDLQLQRWNGAAWIGGASVLVNGNSNVCYFTDSLALADNGAQFRFFASNPAGQVVSNTATVTVAAPGISGTTLVSTTFTGGVPGYLSGQPSISADGRRVAFTSQGTDLIPETTGNGTESGHAYLRDLSTGTTALINRNTAGGVSHRGVVELRLSANGRYAIFSSLANDLVPGDSNGSMDVFRRDLQSGATVRLNLFPDGEQITGAGNGVGESRLGISADGRRVAFISSFDISTGGSGGSNQNYYLYVRDVDTGFTRYVDGDSETSPSYVSMSDDGNWIAYAIFRPNNTVAIFVYEIEAQVRHQVFSYAQGAFPSGSRPGMDVSADGRFVVFALNQPAITGSAHDQVMLVDRLNPGVATVVSTGTNGSGNGSSHYPRISGDGRYVIFETEAPNLTSGQAMMGRRFLMVRDVVQGFTTYGSHRANDSPVWVDASSYGTTAISTDGGTIAFVGDSGEIIGVPADAQVFADPRR